MTTIMFVLALMGGAQDSESDRLERIRRMPPEERQKLRERLDHLKKLPPEERQRLRENLGKLKDLPPEAQKRIHEKVKGLAPEERKASAELARGFFRDLQRRGLAEGFPRPLFFVWIRQEHAGELERIRGMEPADRKDAFIRLYFEFKRFSYEKTLSHVRRHKCAEVSAVEALADAATPVYWRQWQTVVRGCPAFRGGKK